VDFICGISIALRFAVRVIMEVALEPRRERSRHLPTCTYAIDRQGLRCRICGMRGLRSDTRGREREEQGPGLMSLFLTLRPKGFNTEDTKKHREIRFEPSVVDWYSPL